MITAGIDIGSATAKAVIMVDDRIAAWRIIPTTPDGAETAGAVVDLALRDCGLSLKQVVYVVSTGYGRVEVPFAQASLTEITCHARGAHWLNPKVRTILDIGGQDCKAIRCDPTGRVENFAMNDKCAAGTGRYLERVSATLAVPLDQIGTLSLQAVGEPEQISSYCVVFAEDDILLKLRQGKHTNNILAGACDALVSRTVSLIRRVGLMQSFVMCGGVAQNIGIVRRLEPALGVSVYCPPTPQIVGALGAALFASNRARRE